MTLEEEKAALRAEMRRKRRELSPEAREKCSKAICGRLAQLPAFIRAKTVLLYHFVGSEADISALCALAQELKKTVALPRCEESGLMEALEYTGALEPDALGIPAPPDSARRIAPDSLDFVAAPCVAFAADCRRLGSGKGCYDRFLPLCTNAFVALAAFEAQRAEKIPSREWDVAADAAVTELETYTRGG